MATFEHAYVFSGARQIGGTDESVVSTADDDCVEG
jgi:hypothetical protein